MRHHNRARLADITDMKLDPTVEHVVGPDGRLKAAHPVKSEKDKKEKQEEEETTTAQTEDTPVDVVQPAEVTPKKTAKTSKKTNTSKN